LSDPYGPNLLPQHVAKLRASAISDEVALARGYRSMTEVEELAAHGWKGAQLIVPSLLIPVATVAGQSQPLMSRPDEPRVTDAGKTFKYEWQAGQPLRLITHPWCVEALGDPGEPLWLVEGPLKVDALVTAGAKAVIGLNGVSGWRARNDQGGKVASPDWNAVALNQRLVRLAFDSDVTANIMLAKQRKALAAWLRSKESSVEVLELPNDNGKVGPDDFLTLGHTLEDLEDLSEPVEAETESKPPSQATQLVNLAHRHFEIRLSDDGSVFATPKEGPRLTFPLRGGHNSLRAALARRFFEECHSTTSQQALADALLVLEGEALGLKPEMLHLRTARAEGALWLDLGDATGQAARISGTGWVVTDEVPVLFRRSALTSPLPYPVRGGDLSALWKLTNINPDDRRLAQAWELAGLIPDMPHPIAGVFGEQGTAKTTVAKLLVSLVDPSPALVRKPPRDQEAWVTAASGSWFVAIDNVSSLSDWFSDALCRSSTGEGDVRRKLYSDADLVVFSFLRCVIVTGVDLGAVNGDFADRLLPFDLDPIPEESRREEAELWAEWETERPRVLGALLDNLADVLARIPSVRQARKPRMADFGLVLQALDEVSGDTAGMDRYWDKVGFVATDSLTGDPFITAIEGELEEDEEFEGTAAELLDRVTPTPDPHADPPVPPWRPPKGWPGNAREVTVRLRRQAPVMRKAGWLAEDLGADNEVHATKWRLRRPERARNSSSSDSSTSSEPFDETSQTSQTRNEYGPSQVTEEWLFDAPVTDEAAPPLFSSAAGPAPQPRIHVRLAGLDAVVRHFHPDDAAGFEQFVKSSAAPLGLDSETNGMSLWSPGFAVRTVQFGNANEAWVLDAVHSRVIRAALADGSGFVAHNRSFDLLALERTFGIDALELAGRTDDTRIRACLADPRSRGQDKTGDNPGANGHGLKDLCVEALGPDAAEAETVLRALFHTLKLKKDEQWARVPIDHPDFIRYAGTDAILCRRLWERLAAAHNHNQVVAFELRLDTLMLKLTRRGMLLDGDYSAGLFHQLEEEVGAAAARLADFGIAKAGSATQVSDAIIREGGAPLPHTEKGSPSTSEGVLRQRSEAGSSVAAAVLEYRAPKKLRDFVARLIEHASLDGRVHTTINTLGTRTNRMSASEPNLQQLPAAHLVRSCLVADPGNVLASIDLSQVELRILAGLSEEPALTNAVTSADVHSLTADALGVERSVAKVLNFAQLYGAGVSRLARESGVSEDVMAEHLNAWHGLYPGVRPWKNRIEESARRHGRITSRSGLIYPVAADKIYQAANYAVQSEARHVFAELLLALEDAGLSDYLLLPIHDEVLIQAPEDGADEVAVAFSETMTTAYRGVPIVVDRKVGGRSWGSLYG
jgi:DNA polymerase I-like protein with 3'-5' exonuclease and polymerase domains